MSLGANLVTRFSPAPTGYLHVGSARTALFLWLLARGQGGMLRLRIEDTNAELFRDEYLDNLFSTLEWLSIDFDGEVVRQSERSERYRAATDELLAAGQAYRCDCTADDVKERTTGKTPGYDGFCRDRGVADGPTVAVRFRVPEDGATSFTDVIRGEVTFEHRHLEDFVIQRSNGSATFFLPNAVDDIDMQVTHVVRGEDLVNVTPKVLLIREALGVQDRPVFAHLPIIVNEARKKLSKRREDSSVESFQEQGYLPEAFANYLAVLGWGPPDGLEIRPRDEIATLFRLEDVTSSPAFFDLKKLDHFNGEYIRALPAAEFIDRTRPWLPDADRPEFVTLAPLVQERVRTLAEVPAMVDFVFADDVEIDDVAWTKAVAKNDKARDLLLGAVSAYESATWDASTLHAATLSLGEQHGLALGKAQAPIRVAVTGRTVGPPLFESLEVLGRERVLTRLRAALALLAG